MLDLLKKCAQVFFRLQYNILYFLLAAARVKCQNNLYSYEFFQATTKIHAPNDTWENMPNGYETETMKYLNY